MVKLIPECFDSKRKSIHIEERNGRKYKYALFSDYALEVLKENFQEYKPPKWPFESERKARYIFIRTVSERHVIREK